MDASNKAGFSNQISKTKTACICRQTRGKKAAVTVTRLHINQYPFWISQTSSRQPSRLIASGICRDLICFSAFAIRYFWLPHGATVSVAPRIAAATALISVACFFGTQIRTCSRPLLSCVTRHLAWRSLALVFVIKSAHSMSCVTQFPVVRNQRKLCLELSALSEVCTY